MQKRQSLNPNRLTAQSISSLGLAGANLAKITTATTQSFLIHNGGDTIDHTPKVKVIATKRSPAVVHPMRKYTSLNLFSNLKSHFNR